jgi:CGNR zinc finger protein
MHLGHLLPLARVVRVTGTRHFSGHYVTGQVEFSGVSTYILAMEERPPNSEIDTTPAAPGDLELVRAFLSLHDHEPGGSDSVAPSTGTIHWWLVRTGLLDEETPASDDDLRWAGAVLEDLRALIDEREDGSYRETAIARLDRATVATGLSPRFADEELVPATAGVRGAVGSVLAVAFLARLDGSWARLKECASPECRSIFYDRSKNRSGRWCVMAECGNRAKVRAYRERERAGGRG